MHPKCTLDRAAGEGTSLPRRGVAVVFQLEPRVGDRGMGFEPRRVLELVHHVAVRAQREARVVPELAGDVDHRTALVQEQRRKRVAEVVRAGMVYARAVEGAPERSTAPRLVRRLAPERVGC